MFKLLLIWRYFVKKRVAFIAVLAVTLLVCMVLVVLSIMSGLVDDARQRNHQWAGDLILSRSSLVGFPYYEKFIAQLKQNNMVEAATPVIITFTLVKSYTPGQLIGVKLDGFCQVTGFARCLFDRPADDNPSFLVPQHPDRPQNDPTLTAEQRRRGCIVGYGWARNPERLTRQGSPLSPNPPWQVTVFGIDSKGVLTGSEIGESQTFWYVNEHKSSLFDIDDAILVDFDELQRLSWMAGQDGRPARTSEIRIKLKQGFDLNAARREIAALWQRFIHQEQQEPQANLMKDVILQTWQRYRRDFVAPMEKEKSLMIVVFCMIGLVAIFIIFAIFYMIVTEKIKDLGIIKSLGGSKWALAQIFLGYGALVGIVGTFFGTVFGCGIVLNSNEIEGWLNKKFGFRLWDPAVYAIEGIPDVIDFRQAIVIAAMAILACLLGSALPAHRAAKLSVVEALRVE